MMLSQSQPVEFWLVDSRVAEIFARLGPEAARAQWRVFMDVGARTRDAEAQQATMYD